MKIIVAGHICADITPVFGTRFRDIRPAELLRPGQLVMVDSTVIGGGGCVSNTGLALRKLGMDTITIGKIGNDAFGFALKKLFSEYGASGLICDDKSTTSYSYAIAVPGFDRIFIHDPGANNTFVSADVSDEVLGSADYFHFGYPCLMRSIYRDGGKELVSLFKRAKSFGLITSLDFSTILPGSEAAEVEWEEIANALHCLNHHSAPTREEYIKRISKNPLARKVKMNDLESNMDISRIPNPTEKDFERLERYKKEYNFLLNSYRNQ